MIYWGLSAAIWVLLATFAHRAGAFGPALAAIAAINAFLAGMNIGLRLISRSVMDE